MGRKGEKHSIARALYASFVSMRACMLSHFSHVQPFMTPWTVAYQAPVSMGFSRQEYWSGFPCLPPGDLPNPGIKLGSTALQVDPLSVKLPGKPSESLIQIV